MIYDILKKNDVHKLYKMIHYTPNTCFPAGVQFSCNYFMSANTWYKNDIKMQWENETNCTAQIGINKWQQWKYVYAKTVWTQVGLNTNLVCQQSYRIVCWSVSPPGARFVAKIPPFYFQQSTCGICRTSLCKVWKHLCGLHPWFF